MVGAAAVVAGAVSTPVLIAAGVGGCLCVTGTVACYESGACGSVDVVEDGEGPTKKKRVLRRRPGKRQPAKRVRTSFF